MTDFIARLSEFRFSDLGRAQARPTLKNILHLRKKLVILEPDVAIGQCFECQKKKITKRKMDMNIDEQAHGF
jgi:hypothetical protein